MQSKLHVEKHGQGPPLILVHGWGWHLEIWRPLIPLLKNNFTLYLIDLPGFGKSTYVEDVSFHNLAKILFNYVPDEANWLGWSLGGMLATWISIYYPKKINRLITVATLPKFVSHIKGEGVSLDNFNAFSALLKSHQPEALLHFLTLQCHGNPHQVSLIKKLKLLFFSHSPSNITLHSYLNHLAECDLRALLNKIKCKSLHIFGENDALISKSAISYWEEKAINAKSILIPQGGHIPFLTQPTLFLEALHQFFS